MEALTQVSFAESACVRQVTRQALSVVCSEKEYCVYGVCEAECMCCSMNTYIQGFVPKGDKYMGKYLYLMCIA